MAILSAISGRAPSTFIRFDDFAGKEGRIKCIGAPLKIKFLTFFRCGE
jgi:hypothetical protein